MLRAVLRAVLRHASRTLGTLNWGRLLCFPESGWLGARQFEIFVKLATGPTRLLDTAAKSRQGVGRREARGATNRELAAT